MIGFSRLDALSEWARTQPGFLSRDLSQVELAEPFEMTLPAISKHIKVLERAGLVVRGRRAQYRPCALDGARLEEVSTWAEQ